MKKVRSKVAVLLSFILIVMLIPVEASAATKTTAQYNSRPANEYVIRYGNFVNLDGHQYEYFVHVKTKSQKNKKIKLIEKKGAKLGCYSYDYENNRAYKMHDRTSDASKSGKIKYWVYEGTSASGKVIDSGTSKYDSSEYIKLPKSHKNYTIKIRFYITKKLHTTDYVGAALRYVGGVYPKWYLKYDTDNFYTPKVQSHVIYPK